MANFVPLKNYMLYCLDRMIETQGLVGPFLEIGCGRGDVSAHLARRGWQGTAVDFSDAALAQAHTTLALYPAVEVRKQGLDEIEGTWRTVILWDVLEHIDDDAEALRAIERLLAPGGSLVLAVPTNPREWRWDDEFYGHFRRYTVDALATRLTAAGFEPVLFWDFTFPVFWALRRAYTRIKRAPAGLSDRATATKASATVNAWDLPLASRLLDRSSRLWAPVYALQFRAFRAATSRGHEVMALARKRARD